MFIDGSRYWSKDKLLISIFLWAACFYSVNQIPLECRCSNDTNWRWDSDCLWEMCVCAQCCLGTAVFDLLFLSNGLNWNNRSQSAKCMHVCLEELAQVLTENANGIYVFLFWKYALPKGHLQFREETWLLFVCMARFRRWCLTLGKHYYRLCVNFKVKIIIWSP